MGLVDYDQGAGIYPCRLSPVVIPIRSYKMALKHLEWEVCSAICCSPSTLLDTTAIETGVGVSVPILAIGLGAPTLCMRGRRGGEADEW